MRQEANSDLTTLLESATNKYEHLTTVGQVLCDAVHVPSRRKHHEIRDHSSRRVAEQHDKLHTVAKQIPVGSW
jgi:hypothetical protein